MSAEMHAMEVPQEEKILPSIRKNFSGMSEAEREAKLAKVEDERLDSLRPWQVQARELRENEKRLSSIQKRLREICLEVHGLSKAERKAKLLQSEAERKHLNRLMLELMRVGDLITPDYSGMTEAERDEEAQKLKKEMLEEAERLKLQGDLVAASSLERQARVTDFDPKNGGVYTYRPCFAIRGDLDEESPFGPMRFKNESYQDDNMVMPCTAVNIFSVKIASSDVGFPIQVYGTVIARDSIDYKCIYLFNRKSDNCQVITSENDPLTLTGPKRALVLGDYVFVETDLKIKNHQGQDRELSKGFFGIRGIARSSLKCKDGSINTRLSTVDVMYAIVTHAVEATIKFRVLLGKFHGTITAHTTNNQNSIVLYDSEVAGDKTGDGRRIIPLMRSALPVHWEDMLIIVVEMPDAESKHLKFPPMISGEDGIVTFLGATKIVVEVDWSVLDTF